MIPTDDQIKKLWEDYNLPEYKRNHCSLVARVATWFGEKFKIDTTLLRVAALLHDIDKNAQKLPNEHHPDTGVRILREKGFIEVSNLVRTHPLHAILDPTIAPKTIEEKLLYLADKMVKHTIITVDERFALWRKEDLPPDAVTILNATYPKVKTLEKEICSTIGVDPNEISSTIMLQ